MLHPQGFLTGLCEEHASRPVEACTRHVGRRSVECDRSDAVIVDQARLRSEPLTALNVETTPFALPLTTCLPSGLPATVITGAT